jgi:5'-3' exonuclease
MNTPLDHQEIVPVGINSIIIIAVVTTTLFLFIVTLLHVEDTRATLFFDTDREKWRLAYTKKQKQRRQAQQAHARTTFGSTRSARREYHENITRISRECHENITRISREYHENIKKK